MNLGVPEILMIGAFFLILLLFVFLVGGVVYFAVRRANRRRDHQHPQG
ncbi:hypothetical protein [Nonomuraea deserti]|nr:hypothetical protein [Nonomuraea deserti]